MKKYRIEFYVVGRHGNVYYQLEKYTGQLNHVEQWSSVFIGVKGVVEDALKEILATEREVICLTPSIKEITRL